MVWKNILDNWDELIKKQESSFFGLPKKESVIWVAVSDIADSYEVDEEWIGVDKEGGLHWAYASGCSCWEGEYKHEHVKDIKTLKLIHDHAPEEWLTAIDKFDASLEVVKLENSKRNWE